MRIRRIAFAACLSAGLLAAAPAHAAGGIVGTGAITSGCGGGTAQITGINTASNNWIFDVTVLCTNAAPQHVIKTGQWNPATGGPVVGFDTGSLLIGKVTACGANSGVNVQAQMLAAPVITLTASLTRACG